MRANVSSHSSNTNDARQHIDSRGFLQQCQQPAKRVYTWLTLLGTLQTLNTITFAFVVSHLVGHTIDASDTPNVSDSLFFPIAPLAELSQHQLLQALVLILLLQALLPFLRSHLGDHASVKIRSSLRNHVLRQCQVLGIRLQPRFTPSELATLLGQEIDSLRIYFAEYLPQQRLAVIAPLLILIASASVNWLVPLMLALSAPLIPLFMILVGHKASDASQRNLQQLNRLGSLLADRLRHLETLQLSGQVSAESDALYTQSEQHRRSTMEVLRLAFLSGTLLEFFSAISVALVAVYLGLFFLGKYDIGHISPQLTLADGIFLLMLAPEFYLPMRRLGPLYHAKAEATAVAEHLLPLFKQPDSHPVPAATNHVDLSAPVTHIQLINLTVGYDKPVIDSLPAVQLQPGKLVLLQGPSGCGKSTLLDTLAGLRPALGGSILINRQPADLYLNTDWQRQVGYMSQQPELLYASIRDNLCLGQTFSDAALFDALRRAQADTLVQQLPDGLDYMVSEAGYLSGGQAQRIALARVFLHQPRLLLLDEATANLDKETASAFMQGVQRYCTNGGMALIASHNADDTCYADQIIKLPSTASLAEHNEKTEAATC